MTAVRVGRVFNLGNYESLRLEVEVPVLPGQSAAKLMQQLEDILERLRPVPWTVDLADAHQYYQKVVSAGTPLPVDARFQRAETLLSEYRAAIDLRLAAQSELDNLGGAASTFNP